MKKRGFILLLVIIFLGVLGGIIMNENKENKVVKLIDEITDQDGVVINYDYFVNDTMTVKHLTLLDKENLIRFIEENLTIVSLGGASLAEVQEKNKNIEVSFFVPKMPSKPIINGTLRYVYIVSAPGSSTRGVFGWFLSHVDRETGDSDWIYSCIQMTNADKVEMLTHFDPSDFDKLGLKFVEKFYMADLKSGKVKLDFSPIRDVKDFESINSNGFSHAFYKFATVRNSMPLTVVFGVTEKQYDPQDPYPSNWFYLYMKRDKE